MAKYKSIFKVEGTLGEVTFYKGQDGYYIRNKGGVSKKRILNDPNFARTRENLSEFGNVATSGKLLRRSISSLLSDAKDNRVTSRLTQILSKVKNEDLISARGQRNVAVGLENALGKAWLKGFNFNKTATMDSVLQAAYTLDTPTGTVDITDFIPSQQLNVPDGASHVSFSSAYLNLNLAQDVSDLQISPVVNLAINGTASNVSLTPASPATGSGISFYFLKIAFFQEINGIQYPLNNGAFNALQIIEIM